MTSKTPYYDPHAIDKRAYLQRIHKIVSLTHSRLPQTNPNPQSCEVERRKESAIVYYPTAIAISCTALALLALAFVIHTWPSSLVAGVTIFAQKLLAGNFL